MTREQYIVRNCPAFNPQAYEHCCSLDGNYKCEGCTDCVIKQVVELCKEYDKEEAEWCEPIPFCTDNIYDLFDIEEIK